ncbi:hypothetical protein, partial [Rhodopseudomonas sp. BR0G17]
MDVAIIPSREQIDRIEQAKTQLQALGFKDHEMQRMAKELKPRLSHKQQIQAIATRLTLRPMATSQGRGIRFQAQTQRHMGDVRFINRSSSTKCTVLDGYLSG